MSLIQQKIANLLNGVSQRPQEQRHASQAQSQTNGLSHPVRGLMKRPNTEHVSKLLPNISVSVSEPDWSDAFVHPINRDEAEKYHVVIANGDIQVFDALTGEELTVLGLHDDTYLTDSSDSGFRVATAGDTSVIVNRGVTCKRGITKTPPVNFDSLIYIRQADYGTTYKVTINGIQVAIRTVDGDTAAARPDISTDKVASDLLTALQGKTELTNFVFTLFGSTISISNLNAAQDYSLVVQDGLADQGLRAVKGSVQSFEDLPRRAPNGFRVEIAGDPNSNLDNYWVQFDDTKTSDQTGVWIECAAPGTIVDFDPSTLPHRLVRLGTLLPDTPHVGLKSKLGATVVPLDSAASLKWGYLITNGVSGVSAPSTVSGLFGFLHELIIVKDNNDGVAVKLAATYNRLQFSYIIDTSVVVPGNNTVVSLIKNGVTIAATSYEPGKMFSPPSQTDIDKQEALIANLQTQIAATRAKISTSGIFAILYRQQLNTLLAQLTAAQATLQQMLIAQSQSSSPTSFIVTTDASGNPAGQAGDVFELVLTYQLGEAMDTGLTGALAAFHKASLVPSHTHGIVVPTKQIIFDNTIMYPAGVEVVVVVNGTTYNITVSADSTGEEVGAQVNTALQAEGSITASLDASSDARINIFNNDESIPELAVTVGLDNRKVFSNPNLNLASNVFAGFILKNITDGSEGTVSSNTATSITLVGNGPSMDIYLTGGADNIFQPGDICTIVGTGRYFVFEQCPWKNRGAGDLTVCPFPSFVDGKIADVAFYENRLAFVSGENIIFSASGDLFNFFRFSGAQLLPSDLIDVKAAHKEVALFHSLVLWNEGLYAVAEGAEFLVSGEPVLTPSTIRIDVVGHVANTKGVRPLGLGNRLYLMRYKGGFTQIPELYTSDNTTALVSANDISVDTPKYVKGFPKQVIGDDQLGLLFVLTDDDSVLNVFKYQDSTEGREQSSWSKWTLQNGHIISIDLVDGFLGLLVQQSDGIYLEKLDLNVVLEDGSASGERKYLDRRIDFDPAQANVSGAEMTVSGGITTWTLPYLQTANLVVWTQAGVEVVTTRPTSNQIAAVGDFSTTKVYIGVLYPFSYIPSTIYWRNQNDVPEVGGRTQLKFMDVYFHDTTDFVVTVSLDGRDPRDYPVYFSGPTTGSFRFPIMGRNTTAEIEFHSLSPGIVCLSTLDWEGDFTMRSKRV